MGGSHVTVWVPIQVRHGSGLAAWSNHDNVFKIYCRLYLKSIGREEEGLSSNRPELVTLSECLEAHDDHIDLLYLTDSEESLQVIHKWIGGGVKLNLSKSTDVDVLKVIILKLQRRVDVGATTLMIKVKTHRGDPLNEESDIRTLRNRSSQRVQGNDLKWLVRQNCVSMAPHLHETRGNNSSQDL